MTFVGLDQFFSFRVDLFRQAAEAGPQRFIDRDLMGIDKALFDRFLGVDVTDPAVADTGHRHA